MRSILTALVLLTVAALGILLAEKQQNSAQSSEVLLRHVSLPTSKMLLGASPGVVAELDGFTPAIALSPDHRYAAFLHDGYGSQNTLGRQSISILDLNSNQLTNSPDERLGEDAPQSYFIGLGFSSDGKHLYASVGSVTDPTGEKAGDTGNGIAEYSFTDGKITPARFMKIPLQKVGKGKKVAYGLRQSDKRMGVPYPAGFAVIPGGDGKADKLLIANNYSDSVVLLETDSGQVLKTIDVSEHKIVPAEFPYSCVVARDGVRAWCSLWNASKVVMLNLESGHIVRSIPLHPPAKPTDPGSHPTTLLLSADESLLFVALSNADQVMMVAVGSGPDRPLGTSLISSEGKVLTLAGSCPGAMALSGDGSKLFVADSCLNAVAVFDVAGIRTSPMTVMPVYSPAGFIPTDWYPTALATVGNDLLIATSKGQGTGPNNFPGKSQYEKRQGHAYIATLLHGSVARLNITQTEQQLPELTKRVVEANRLDLDPGSIRFAQGTNPIRHVIYIIKENRTYDQILGDLKVGNGDPSLTMYGGDVTPNLHKLALQYGVLDNFYDSGEVSGNGHDWSTSAITSDYDENTWQIAYRGKERTYDFQGDVTDELPLENNEPDVNEPSSGYIWDDLAAHGVSFRDYGEFVNTIWCTPERVASPQQGTASPFEAKCPRAEVQKGEPLPSHIGQPHGSASPWPWPVPMMLRTKATKAVLREHIDTNFPDFNTDYPDQLRADQFLNEFDGFVDARGTASQMPSFVLLYLPNDHTHGTTPGHPRPAASVADNDLAVGRVVEAVSHSPYWDDTAIFIVEDDAQNGADHVDAHRSTAYVISKYSPGSAGKPYVDHHFYTTVSVIHTMESLLGLPAMNQNDAYAPLMTELFSGAGHQPAFTADWSNRDDGLLYQINPPKAEGAKQSAAMDFSRPDAANAAVLNAVLWRDRKGNVPMPGPEHSSLSGDSNHQQ